MARLISKKNGKRIMSGLKKSLGVIDRARVGTLNAFAPPLKIKKKRC